MIPALIAAARSRRPASTSTDTQASGFCDILKLLRIRTTAMRHRVRLISILGVLLLCGCASQFPVRDEKMAVAVGQKACPASKMTEAFLDGDSWNVYGQSAANSQGFSGYEWHATFAENGPAPTQCLRYTRGIRDAVGLPLQQALKLAAAHDYKQALQRIATADSVTAKTDQERATVDMLREYISAVSHPSDSNMQSEAKPYPGP